LNLQKGTIDTVNRKKAVRLFYDRILFDIFQCQNKNPFTEQLVILEILFSGRQLKRCFLALLAVLIIGRLFSYRQNKRCPHRRARVLFTKVKSPFTAPKRAEKGSKTPVLGCPKRGRSNAPRCAPTDPRRWGLIKKRGGGPPPFWAFLGDAPKRTKSSRSQKRYRTWRCLTSILKRKSMFKTSNAFYYVKHLITKQSFVITRFNFVKSLLKQPNKSRLCRRDSICFY